MSLQWPLILFTTLLAWSCGLFATQGIVSLQNKNNEGSDAQAQLQMKVLLISLVLLVLSGIAVFFHLQHWERIFNGFGHITSGITQELIFIVVMAIAMVCVFACLRQNGKGKIPAWASWFAIISSVILIIVAGHSYMMPARPAWDSFLEPISLLGEACAMGPLSYAVIAKINFSKLSVYATAINAATTLIYGAYLQACSLFGFSSVGYYFDNVHPNKPMVDPGAIAVNQSLLIWLGAFAIGAVVPLVLVLLARKKKMPAQKQIKIALVSAICVIAGAICLRCAFYFMGIDIFTLY